MKIYQVILALVGLLMIVFIVIVGHDLNIDRDYNWYESYNSMSKDPYGTYVFFDQLEEAFEDKDVKSITSKVFKAYDEQIYKLPVYKDYVSKEDKVKYDEVMRKKDSLNGRTYQEEYDEILLDETIAEELEENSEEDSDDYIYLDEENYDNYDYDSITIFRRDSFPYEIPKVEEYKSFNFLSVNNIFELNEYDSKSLLIHIHQGNHAFIASNEFAGLFAEHFEIRTKQRDENELSDEEIKNQWVFSFNKKGRYNFNRKNDVSDTNKFNTKEIQYFDNVPNSTVVATNKLGDPVVIQTKFGKGSIFWCSTPLAFTNYFMFRPKDVKFTEKCVRTLSDEDLYWSNNYTSYNGFEWPDLDKTYLEFIKSKPSLKWAFYLLLWTVIIFTIVGIKRRQKAIPLITPPKNSTLQFVDTIAQLYLQSSNHSDMIDKKLRYFLEYLRSKYNVKTSEIDEELISKLAEKTGYEVDKLQNFFAQLTRVANTENASENELHTLHKQIEKFKNGKL